MLDGRYAHRSKRPKRDFAFTGLVRCGHCGREAVQSIETPEVPKTCPFCNDEWEVDLSQGSRGWNHALVANMQRILKEHPWKMTIRFEIDGEDKRD